jgi:hypothetical protein
MKASLLFFLLTLIYSGISAQTTNAFKGANTIVVRTDSSKIANYEIVVNQLISNGYEIGEEKKEYGIIKSGTRSVPGVNGIYYLYFVCKDGEITISGQFRSNVEYNFGGATSTNSFETIVNRGMDGSILKNSFVAMETFAKVIGTQLEYIKR